MEERWVESSGLPDKERPGKEEALRRAMALQALQAERRGRGVGLVTGTESARGVDR